MYKYELHAHTADCDMVAHFSGAEMVNLYKDAGYGGIVITDHCFAGFFDWFKEEISGADHKRIIDRYLKGYYSAKNEGEKKGFSVLCGAEVRFENTDNDYLVYGLEEEDFYSLPFLCTLENVEEMAKILPEKAVIVQAHPFRYGMTIFKPDCLFGLEVHNGASEKICNDLAKMYAAHFGKAVTSGSDFHEKFHLGRGGIETDEKIITSADLVNTLKNGNYSIIENYK